MKIDRPAAGNVQPQESSTEVKSAQTQKTSQKTGAIQRDVFIKGDESKGHAGNQLASFAGNIFGMAKLLSQGGLAEAGAGAITQKALASQAQASKQTLNFAAVQGGASQLISQIISSQQEKISSLAQKAIANQPYNFAAGKIHDFVQNALKNTAPFLQNAMRIAERAANAAGSMLDPGFYKNLAAAMKEGFTRFGENFVSHLKTGLRSWLLQRIPGGGDVGKLFDLTRQALGNKLNQFTKGIFEVGQKVFEGLRGVGMMVQKSVHRLGEAIHKGIGAIEKAVDKVTQFAGRTIDAVIGKVGTALKNVLGRITQLGNAAISTALNSIKVALSKVGDAVGKGIGFMTKVADKAAGMVHRMADFANHVVDRANNFAKSAVRGAASLVTNVADKLGSFVQDKISGIGQKVNQAITHMTKIAEKAAGFVGNVAEKVAKTAGKVALAAGRAMNAIRDFAQNVLDQQMKVIAKYIPAKSEIIDTAAKFLASETRNSLSGLSIIPLPLPGARKLAGFLS